MSNDHHVPAGPVARGAAGMLLMLGAAAAQATLYEVIGLGTLGGPQSEAWGINDHGQVVGRSRPSITDYTQHAFLWDSAGGMQDLGTLGGASAEARAINNAGQVVGWSHDDAGRQRAFLWDAIGGMIDLGTLGGNVSIATGINDLGQVAGWSNEYAGGPAHAFVWDSTGGMLDLGTFGSFADFEPRAINESGLVAGKMTVTYGTHRAFLHDAGGYQDLGTLGNTAHDWAEARGINDAGQVVGTSAVPADYSSTAFLWDASGGMQDLGNLPGGWTADAWGINDAGQVVGRALTTVTGSPRGDAFLWDSTNGMRDLNDLASGWYLADARAINQAGWIAGDGTRLAGGFALEAAVIRPLHTEGVPEPPAGLLLAGGLAGLATARHRARARASDRRAVLGLRG